MAAKKTTSIVVHCHLANPGPEEYAFLHNVDAWLAELTPEIRLAFSVGDAAYKEKAFYTCLRFLTISHLIGHYGTGVMIMDIDAAMTPEFFNALPALLQHDFGLRKYSFDREGRQVGGEPWSIAAYPCYVSNTPVGQRFAAFIKDYIARAYDPDLSTNWTIDQCAIARANELVVEADPQVKVLNLAFEPTLVLSPDSFGGKEGMADAAKDVSFANFHDHLEMALGRAASAAEQ